MTKITGLFKYVSPMTHIFLIEGIMWGMLMVVHIAFDSLNILSDDALMGYFPINLLWSLSIVLLTATLVCLLVHNKDNRGSRWIWFSSVICVMLWVFGAAVWLEVGAWAMLGVSVIHIVGFSYIGFSSKFNKYYHRI